MALADGAVGDQLVRVPPLSPMRSLLARLAVGCDTDGIDGSLSDFGDPYGLDTQADAPTLVDTQLSVPVTYGGGCTDHTFTLRSRTRGDAAAVWFEHDANGDLCEALLAETVEAELPRDIAGAKRITLRVPAALGSDGERTVVLR